MEFLLLVSMQREASLRFTELGEQELGPSPGFLVTVGDSLIGSIGQVGCGLLAGSS